MTTVPARQSERRHRHKGEMGVCVTDQEQFIPPWQDMPTLCRHICASPNTVDAWVAKGILPPPRPRGGKQMWKWAEVDAYLTDGGAGSPDAEADRIRENVRRAAEESRAGH